MRTRLLFVEQVFTAAALMLYSGGPLNVVLSGGYSQGEQRLAEPDYALTRYLFLLTYIVISALLFCRWKKVVRLVPYSFAVLPMLLLASISYFWSAIPEATLTGAIGLFGTTLLGFYIAIRYSPRQQLQILGWAFGLIVVLSFIYGFIFPKYGIMGGVHAGTWRGVFTHKNTLGKMMTLSSTIFTLLLIGDRRNRAILGLFLGMSILLMLLTTSRGALVNMLIMLIFISVCQILRAGYRQMIASVAAAVLIFGTTATLLIANLETIVVDILGKDPTFTGRTTLWISALEVIKVRPWLGYGYEAFWDGMRGPSAYIWRDVMWPAPDAHNGFVELLLHLGIVGLITFLVGYVLNFARCIYLVRNTVGAEFIWPFAYLLYTIISNIPEQSLLKSNNIFWVIYVTVSVTLFMPNIERFSESVQDVSVDELQRERSVIL